MAGVSAGKPRIAMEELVLRIVDMAYDEKLADRVRRALGPRADVTEKKMFGGLAFLVDGKMFVGISNDELMVRVGPERYDAALADTHARPMDAESYTQELS